MQSLQRKQVRSLRWREEWFSLYPLQHIQDRPRAYHGVALKIPKAIARPFDRGPCEDRRFSK